MSAIGGTVARLARCALASRRLASGFTLIEVLVAVAMVAVALAAGAAASSSSIRGAERQREVTLAQLCANNALVSLQLARQLPAAGSSSFACRQGGLDYEVRIEVALSPGGDFRQVHAQASRDAQVMARLSTVLGRY
ncbi:MAG: type II secretion system minor pseudopilin GspI [Pseudomonadota bacterium]